MNMLVIDDDADILDAIVALLEHMGHTVVTARGGKNGIDEFEKRDFDMVLTDIFMPDLDGKRVARHIRESGKTSVRVVGMSGTPWAVNKERFDAFLSKPFSIMDICNCIEDLWARPKMATGRTRSTVSPSPGRA